MFLNNERGGERGYFATATCQYVTMWDDRTKLPELAIAMRVYQRVASHIGVHWQMYRYSDDKGGGVRSCRSTLTYTPATRAGRFRCQAEAAKLIRYLPSKPGWRNWQTQRTQNPPRLITSWGFDPPPGTRTLMRGKAFGGSETARPPNASLSRSAQARVEHRVGKY